MGQLKYILYTIAAAMMAAAASIKDSADNVPAYLEADEDGVLPESSNTTTETTVNTTTPAFDAAGLPWDERIHSSTKSMKADGTWTRRKGVADTTIATVTAELRARTGGAPTALPTPGAPAGVQLPAIGGLPTPGAPALTNYQKLVAYLAAKTGPGKQADDAWVNAAFAGWGLSLAGLATDEANSAAVLAEFKKVLGE